jgi:hypothetical protein
MLCRAFDKRHNILVFTFFAGDKLIDGTSNKVFEFRHSQHPWILLRVPPAIALALHHLD